MVGQRLAIEMGTLLHVEVPARKVRFQTTLVGMKPPSYVILEAAAPLFDGRVSGLVRNEELAVRYLHAGSVYAFRTAVVGSVEHPVPLIFLRYPHHIEEQDSRKHRRAVCNIPARLTAGDHAVEGYVLDLSLGGCQFVTRPQLANPDKPLPLKLDDEVELGITLAEGGDEQRFTGTIRNIRADNFGGSLGVQFREIDQSRLENLARFLEHVEIYPRMAK